MEDIINGQSTYSNPDPEAVESIAQADSEFSPFNSEYAKVLSESLAQVIPTMDENFEITSAIRYEPEVKASEINEDNFFLLRLHWLRMQYAADFFNWDVEIPYKHLLSELINTVKELDISKPYKLRILVSKDNILRIEATAVEKREDLFSGLNKRHDYDPVYNVYIDDESSLVGPFTSFKTTKRDVYSKSRERKLDMSKGARQEVLLFNSRDEITEGSITNVAFRRNDRWITPTLSVGCLCGVVRHHLLTTHQIQEGIILKKSVKVGEPVLLFNGVIGVVSGLIC